MKTDAYVSHSTAIFKVRMKNNVLTFHLWLVAKSQRVKRREKANYMEFYTGNQELNCVPEKRTHSNSVL